MNVTERTRKYISKRPSVKDCLLSGLINYSALARQICDEEGIDSFDAVLVACRRYSSRFRAPKSHQKEIAALIKKAKLRVRNKLIVAVIDKPKDLEKFHALRKVVKAERGDFNIIEGEEVVTLITNEEFLSDIRIHFKGRVKKVRNDVVQISLLFSEKLETTSGVVSYVYGLLAENGINVLEEMSCWTDLMIIIDEKDLPKALPLLSFS